MKKFPNNIMHLDKSWLHRAAVLAGSILLVGSVGAVAQDVPEWVESRASIYYRALAESDVDTMASNYADDAVIVIAGAGENGGFQRIEGRKAIRDHFQSSLERADYQCTWQVFEVQPNESMASVSGTHTCVTTSLQDGSDRTVTTKWMTVYQQQSDGRWLVVFENL